MPRGGRNYFYNYGEAFDEEDHENDFPLMQVSAGEVTEETPEKVQKDIWSSWFAAKYASEAIGKAVKVPVTPCQIALTDVKRKRLFSIRLYQFAYVACMLVVW